MQTPSAYFHKSYVYVYKSYADCINLIHIYKSDAYLHKYQYLHKSYANLHKTYAELHESYSHPHKSRDISTLASKDSHFEPNSQYHCDEVQNNNCLASIN